MRKTSRRSALTAAGLALAGMSIGAPAAKAQGRPMTAEEKANLKVVDDFIAAWNTRDAAKVATFLAPEARFSAGPIGQFAPLRAPQFDGFIARTKSIRMTVKPGTQSAHGPMVTHERVDEMVLQDGSTQGSGTWFGVFGLKGGRIVDFIDFQIA